MFLSFILILLFTAGGLGLTYLFADDESLMWRICAGNVVGSVVFGLVCFLIACFFGFTVVTLSIAFLISLTPLLLFINKANRAEFRADWSKAKRQLEGATFSRFLRFCYYAFFLVVFYFFFKRAMFQTANGIFTGASQNYGDLPFHLGAIFSFTDGENFPPENPSYAFAKFTYPFMADLITAVFAEFGATVPDAMLVQSVFLAFALLVILERFVFKLTGSRLAGKIAPPLLFFSGGLGFLWFVKDYWQSAQSFFHFIWNLPFDYTIRDQEGSERFRWGSSLVVLFITQKSLLLGMPLTIIVLQKLWEIFCGDETVRESGIDAMRRGERQKDVELEHRISTSHPLNVSPVLRIVPPSFLIGMLAGTLPLVHVHSLAVLFVVSAFLFFLRLDKWREWLTFALGVSVVAVPQLIWVMTGSATRLTEFFDWNFGWDKGDANFFWFWLKNTGAFIPLLLFGLYLVSNAKARKLEGADKNRKTNDEERMTKDDGRMRSLLLFSLPFFLLFLVSNVVKLAPWQWDNVKVLIYWFIGSLPFVAFVLAWLWNHPSKILKTAAVGCLIVLIASGALDVWRTMSKGIINGIFSKDAVAIAEQIKRKTAPKAMFLNAPTFNSAVVLSGRRSLMRYTGHLFTYGIDFSERQSEVKLIYAGDAIAARTLFEKYGIQYVLISPEERAELTVINEDFFRRFPVVAEAGEYRVYQIKK